MDQKLRSQLTEVLKFTSDCDYEEAFRFLLERLHQETGPGPATGVAEAGMQFLTHPQIVIPYPPQNESTDGLNPNPEARESQILSIVAAMVPTDNFGLIWGIKQYRLLTGADLQTAKGFVQNLIERLRYFQQNSPKC